MGWGVCGGGWTRAVRARVTRVERDATRAVVDVDVDDGDDARAVIRDVAGAV